MVRLTQLASGAANVGPTGHQGRLVLVCIRALALSRPDEDLYLYLDRIPHRLWCTYSCIQVLFDRLSYSDSPLCLRIPMSSGGLGMIAFGKYTTTVDI